LTGPLVVFALGLRPVPLVDRVTFLDVGQGDAALVELSSGQRLLVDGGPPSERVLRWLRRRGIGRLDAVVATHADADHLGGLMPVLRSLDVEALWIQDPDGMDEAIDLAVGRSIDLVRFAEEKEGSRNDRSLVVVAAQTLFTGDIGMAREARLLTRLGPVPVLKVPHHGSRSSSSAALLDAIQPRIAVVGVGRHNRYGHPHPDVVDRYRQRDIELFRTDVHGTIEVTLHPPHLVVRCFRAGPGWSRARSFRAKKEDSEGDAGEANRDPLGVGQRLSEEALDEVTPRLVSSEGL
jgi:competence protein ComEC